MTITVPMFLAVFVLAAATGAAAALSMMRRRAKAALATRSSLREENALLRQQLTFARAVAEGVRGQLKDILRRSVELSAPSRRGSSSKSSVPLRFSAPPKPSATPRPGTVRTAEEERVDDSGRTRTSEVRELGAGRTVLQMPRSEEVDTLAERLWYSGGEPLGREREFWLQAELQLIGEVNETPAVDESKKNADENETAVG